MRTPAALFAVAVAAALLAPAASAAPSETPHLVVDGAPETVLAVPGADVVVRGTLRRVVRSDPLELTTVSGTVAASLRRADGSARELGPVVAAPDGTSRWTSPTCRAPTSVTGRYRAT